MPAGGPGTREAGGDGARSKSVSRTQPRPRVVTHFCQNEWAVVVYDSIKLRE